MSNNRGVEVVHPLSVVMGMGLGMGQVSEMNEGGGEEERRKYKKKIEVV